MKSALSLRKKPEHYINKIQVVREIRHTGLHFAFRYQLVLGENCIPSQKRCLCVCVFCFILPNVPAP